MKLPILILTFTFLSHVNHAQTTSIPDSNFEQALIDLGYDSGTIDGVVQTANISTIDSLNLYNKNISDLSGIEDFAALTHLNCVANQISSIDISQNVALIYFSCSANQLTSIDVSQNTSLVFFQCGSNQLSSLDISQNTLLDYLECVHNQLISLDVSQNVNLTELYCFENDISSLDVSYNTLLNVLNCRNNSLICLNAKNGNNTAIIAFWIDGNPELSCITVDNAQWSTDNWTNNIDPISSFSEDCENSCTLSANEYLSKAYQLTSYPNPTTGMVTIKFNENLGYNQAILFNSLGERIQSYNVNNLNQITVNINSPSGLYFLVLHSDISKSKRTLIVKK